MKITTIGIDIAKSIFHLYAISKMGRYVKKKQLKRHQLLAYLARLEPCVIAMEACGGANYWAREIKALGHEVKLIALNMLSPMSKATRMTTTMLKR